MNISQIPNHAQKRNQFRVQIRRQALQKIFALKRIKPKLIQSDDDALKVVVDGHHLLKSQDLTEQLAITVLKSIADALKKYEFDATHSKLISCIMFEANRMFAIDSIHRQMVKQCALEVLACLSFNKSYSLTFDMIPFEVLNGLNMKMIKSCILALNYMLDYCNVSTKNDFKKLFNEIHIMKKMITVLANFWNTKQCFQIIKPLFVRCAVTLCYLQFKTNICQQSNDFKQLLKFCVKCVESDIEAEAEKDQSLRVYFERYYEPMTLDEMYEKTNELAYPFSAYETVVRMTEVNPNVVNKMTDCLRFQIRERSVQEPLVRCLAKIYYETELRMDDELKREIFCYIFGLEYAKQQSTQWLRFMLIMLGNEFVNSQSTQKAILQFMGDWEHKLWPHTCHLLEVMQFLEIKEDYLAQEKLLELVMNHLVTGGCEEILEECHKELRRFEAGYEWLSRQGYLGEGIEGMDEWVGDEEIEI